MAVLYPEYHGDYPEGTPSSEIKFYEACQALPNDYHIFHSVGWVSRSRGHAQDGEADFLVCHRDRGFLVGEVKGGRIRADYATSRWTSTDREGRDHVIKDPFKQALDGKFKIYEKLKEHKDWGKLDIRRPSFGHAAFFPDVDDCRMLQGPNAPAQIIGDRTDLGDLNTWMEKAFDHWGTMDAAHPANLIGELMPWAYQAMVVEQKAEIEVKNGA